MNSILFTVCRNDAQKGPLSALQRRRWVDGWRPAGLDPKQKLLGLAERVTQGVEIEAVGGFRGVRGFGK